MNILSILSGVLKLASILARYAERRGLMNQGKVNAMAKANDKALKNVAKAQVARRSVRHDADGVRDDTDNRDNG